MNSFSSPRKSNPFRHVRRSRLLALLGGLTATVACANGQQLDIGDAGNPFGSFGGFGNSTGGNSNSGTGGFGNDGSGGFGNSSTGGDMTGTGTGGIPGTGGGVDSGGVGSGGIGSGGIGSGGIGSGGIGSGGIGSGGVGTNGGAAGTANGGTAGATGGGGAGGAAPTCDNPNQKYCGGGCVAPDPTIGCSLTGCTACPGSANGHAICTGAACDLACDNGYQKSGSGSSCQLIPTSCSDSAQNGTETDLNCGGASCPPCADGKMCKVGADCVDKSCQSNVCQPPTCSDLVANGNETDVDCGGPGPSPCNRCDTGKTCAASTDCLSAVCTGKKCQAPLCTDSTKNGNETDVDCGGGTCGKCKQTQGCGAVTDCVSHVCTNSKCADPVVTAFPYTPSNFDPAAVDPTTTDPTTNLNCGTSTFDSGTLTFGNFCGFATPTPVVVHQTNGPDVVVLPFVGFSIAAGATLKITGSRPVVIAVFGDSTIAGTIDASASAAVAGAGGNGSMCTNATGKVGTGNAGLGTGGGGGGGHAAAGSSGGNSTDGNYFNMPNHVQAGSAGGAALSDPNSTPLSGGCAGGGGASDLCNKTAPGGAGGGGVQLSVAGTLTFSGTIKTDGGIGSNACGFQNSGAGGGSGGSVLLEGNVVNTTAASVISAKGGAGGKGAGGVQPGAGGPGGDETTPGGTKGADSPDGAGGGGGSVGLATIRGSTSCSVLGVTHASLVKTCP